MMQRFRGNLTPLVLLFVICSLSIANADSAPVFLGRWGSPGSGDGQFTRLGGIAVDRDGYVYAADLYANRIQKFAPTGAVVLKLGSFGSGDGQFTTPTDVAVDADGYIYVADFDNTRIQKFTPTGVYVSQWSILAGSTLLSPLYVAVGPDNAIYVTASCFVYKFDRDGNLLTRWGGISLSEPGLFGGAAYGIAASSAGVYVADHTNDRIQRFAMSGAFLSTWGTAGHGDGEFVLPFGVASDSVSNVFVSASSRIQKFDQLGTFLTTWGKYGRGDGDFIECVDIAIGARIIYVADSIRNDIQLFGDVPTPTVDISWGQVKLKYR